MTKNLIIYDGVCIFCEGWVNFVLQNTSEGNENYFVALQNVELKPQVSDLASGDASIILLTDKAEVFMESDASLRVMISLYTRYSIIARLGLFVPRIIRNIVYNLVGRNRYKIWGRYDVCPLPPPEVAKFFPRSPEQIPTQLKNVFDKNARWK